MILGITVTFHVIVRIVFYMFWKPTLIVFLLSCSFVSLQYLPYYLVNFRVNHYGLDTLSLDQIEDYILVDDKSVYSLVQEIICRHEPHKHPVMAV